MQIGLQPALTLKRVEGLAMLSANETLRYRVIGKDPLSLWMTDYRSVALRFCESLMKNEAAAESVVNAVFREIEEKGIALQSEQKLKAYLFIRLRDQCVTYLRTADKSQLLRLSCVEQPAKHSDAKWVEWRHC